MAGCPLLNNSGEEFCLLDNCRYYDTRLGQCGYNNRNENLDSRDDEKPLKTADPDEAEYDKREKEIAEDVYETTTGTREIELSAKELWDRLSAFHKENIIPRYDDLINDLIKVVNTTPTLHYLTPRPEDFWYQHVEGLENYRNILKEKKQLS